jgi:hypothetical protein
VVGGLKKSKVIVFLFLFYFKKKKLQFFCFFFISKKKLHFFLFQKRMVVIVFLEQGRQAVVALPYQNPQGTKSLRV